MNIAKRFLILMLSGIKSYGPTSIKKFLWDKEYSGNKWDFADNTFGDCVYSHLEKHLKKGKILDLGCGSGNTANELDSNSYLKYIGVDISEVSLNKAKRRTNEIGRNKKNDFVFGDFINYVPQQKFDVILFRESMYHVPIGRITYILDRYSKYLNDGGVFIVRMGTTDLDGNIKARPTEMISIIENEYEVVEKSHYKDSGATVIVFRLRSEKLVERNINN